MRSTSWASDAPVVVHELMHSNTASRYEPKCPESTMGNGAEQGEHQPGEARHRQRLLGRKLGLTRHMRRSEPAISAMPAPSR